VANFVVLSPTVCVVAVVPFGNAGIPLRFAAVPLVFAALFGMSALSSAGSCAWGRIPVVRSDALTTTLELKAWPLTVVVVGTPPRPLNVIAAAAP
jgi:hypothetical protein